jgi:hypothetical protein
MLSLVPPLHLTRGQLLAGGRRSTARRDTDKLVHCCSAAGYNMLKMPGRTGLGP